MRALADTDATLTIDPGARPWPLRAVEALAVFALGVLLMNHFYAHSTPRPDSPIGVPEHDSYYHVAMASMLPEHGVLRTFPWLQYTYFRDQGHDFVSHHWGFHLLLFPFVKAGEWLRGDALAGGRWAMSAVFGVNLLLFHLLLRQRRVPWHWLWIALFVLLPEQYHGRHGYVRAIGSSLMFMQLAMLALFAGRIWLAAITVGAYVHLYLGAVFFGPLIVASYAVSHVIAPRDERVWPWRLVLITAGGWLVGVLTYPYSGGMYEFLKMQVFGSGLSPDIEVGREWKPYSDAWFLIRMAAPLLVVWSGALLLRVRMGPRFDARETALLMLQFLFLLLTFKARRFIEYWPLFALLSAAYLAAPPLRAIIAEAAAAFARRSERARFALISAAVLIGVSACAAAWQIASDRPGAAAFVNEWRVWAPLIALLALPALCMTWAGVPLRWSAGARVAVLVSGVILVAVAGVACGLAATGAGRLRLPSSVWGLLILAYTLLPLLASRAGQASSKPAYAAARTLGIILAGIGLPAATLAVGSRSLASAAGQLHCYYDLGDVRQLMTFLRQDAQPGDIVFTDDWDIFPVFFYHNRHNHYIVGLDPKFTHQRDPDLWSKYVKISRGEVPATIRLARSESGRALTAPVGLENIRSDFRARYVVADRDHRRLADALSKTPELAEFVYPGPSYAAARNAQYVVFRIRHQHESAAYVAALNAAKDCSTGPVALGEMRPTVNEQGWGTLGVDRSVEGRAIRLAGQSFERGLGTHAPARLVYPVPDGAAWFEAVVGIDDETDGQGSAVVSIRLDGEGVYESPRLLGGDAPVAIRIPIAGRKQLELRAEPTSDGRRFDHVCWGNARFMPADSSPALGASDEPRFVPEGTE